MPLATMYVQTCVCIGDHVCTNVCMYASDAFGSDAFGDQVGREKLFNKDEN